MPKGLVPVRLPVPGSLGVNTQRQADILPAQWATVAKNCVFDDSNRLASRKGYQQVNATALTGTPDVKTIHEYIDSGGLKLVIVAAGNKIYKVAGDVLTDISGTITTPTADNWKFQNFNGKCVGFQAGHAPIVLTSVIGTFADISMTGTQQPTTSANEVLAAFGRLWVLDGTDLKYSDALDETTWNGVFDLTTVWLSGIDVGVALAEFNGYLVVFGKQSTVVYTNPWVPTGGGGIDTSTMELVENIGGIGCISRDSVQYIGTDLLFLSSQGLRSLGRTIQEKSMPVRLVSQNVNDEMMRLVSTDNEADIKSCYSAVDGFYMLSLPASNITYYFDLRVPLDDGSFRTTYWDTHFKSMFVADDSTVYLGNAGYLNKYQNYLDGVASDGTGGSKYTLEFTSGWNDLSEVDPRISSLLKILKSASFLILGGSGQTVIIKWAFDFEDTFISIANTLKTSGASEWGEAEYNVGEYSGGLIYNRVKGPMRKSGQVIKFGLTVDVNGEEVALQHFDMLIKTGRLAA